MAELNDVTEVVAEAAETVAEGGTHVAEISRRLSSRDIRLVLAGVGVGALVGGAITGLVVSKRLIKKYSDIAESEIEQMREHFRAKEIARDEREIDISELQRRVAESGYGPAPEGQPNTLQTSPPAAPQTIAEAVHEEQMAKEVVSRNIFEDHGEQDELKDEWDYQVELSNRTVYAPYVIHVDEQGEKGYDTETYTYYEADDVVVNEEENPVESPGRILGERFDEKFGHGSGDPNVVYIRNDQISMEIEVIRTPESYAEVVHGMSDPSSLEHQRRIRRAQIEDDD